VARLDHQKGIDQLLAAIPEVPAATFCVAGEGDLRSTLEELAERLGISDRVVFLGHRTDIPRLLIGCDLFVLPSRYEGFPLSVLEAMAAAKPVVATAVGGTPEAVVDGATGYLTTPGDPAGLAACIRLALSDPPRAREMGLRGRERVHELYSAPAMVAAYTRLYGRFATPPGA
jgi:glycosyltransferase involved in cell wall biosynthesis